jgi:transposase
MNSSEDDSGAGISASSIQRLAVEEGRLLLPLDRATELASECGRLNALVRRAAAQWHQPAGEPTDFATTLSHLRDADADDVQ